MVKQKKLLLKCNDGTVIIMSMVLNDGHGIDRVGTVSEIEDEIRRASSAWDPNRLPIVEWSEISDDDIPTDRDFRNAWFSSQSGKIHVDMPRAREIHRNRLRALRQPMLEQLDVEYMRADESGDVDEKRRITEKKRELRNITSHPGIDSAETPDELKRITIK